MHRFGRVKTAAVAGEGSSDLLVEFETRREAEAAMNNGGLFKAGGAMFTLNCEWSATAPAAATTGTGADNNSAPAPPAPSAAPTAVPQSATPTPAAVEDASAFFSTSATSLESMVQPN